MKKQYKNKMMVTESADSGELQVYFFPKANPPVSIRAHSREEAEKTLEAINKK